MLSDTGKTVENPQEYNSKISEIISQPGAGCTSTRACDNCGAIISDSICLCVGVFDCPRCGHENGIRWQKFESELLTNQVNLNGDLFDLNNVRIQKNYQSWQDGGGI